ETGTQHVQEQERHIDITDEKTVLLKKRMNTIKYGLVSDIISLIEELKKENNASLNETLCMLCGRTKSSELKALLFDFFLFQKNDCAQSVAVDVLQQVTEHNPMVVKSAIRYISGLEARELTPLLREVLSSEVSQYADECIVALGNMGSTEDSEFLVRYYENIHFDDDKKTLIRKQNVMAALEQLHAEHAFDFFKLVVMSSEENSVVRASAAVGLAGIGRSDAVEILSVLSEESDPILRIASIKGAGLLDTDEARNIVIEGFRDTHYRARLEALAVAERVLCASYFPYVLYRAQSDPVDAVLHKAVDLVAKYNLGEGNDWLRDVLLDEKKSDTLRARVAAAGMQYTISALYQHIEKVMLDVVLNDTKKQLRYALGKAFAKTRTELGQTIAAAYLASKDVLTVGIGLDMYQTNQYSALSEHIEKIAGDNKFGALQAKARQILARQKKES
ncbi:HEAT repeat domain-containing protein, partial [Treponema pallidum]